ncbi:MAG: hypothetical protein EBT03_08110 [Betaproteobacteria bacterium]|nr:hypothetical protein [Betaproteobacteria bacterium]NCA16909.1 hypothetical protein [Betaproteobacteria bacterium]
MRIEECIKRRLPFVRKLTRGRQEQGGYIVEMWTTMVHRGRTYEDWLPLAVVLSNSETRSRSVVLAVSSHLFVGNAARRKAARLADMAAVPDLREGDLSPMLGDYQSSAFCRNQWSQASHLTLLELVHNATYGSDPKWAEPL